MNPWLTVVMPTYRGARYVADALTSVADQDDDGVECIVLDDGSDDDTRAIARSFASRMNVRVLDGAKRGNWVASTNLGLREARAPHACFLHQDDGFRRGRLAAIRRVLTQNPDVRLVFHAADLVDSNGSRLTTWRASVPRANARMTSRELVERLLVQNFVAIPTPVFRTADALTCGGLDESLWYTADWDLWLSLAELGDVIYLDEPLAWFRVHGDSQTMTRSGDASAFREQMTTVLDRHLVRCVATGDARHGIEAAARLSIETNVLLATLARGARPDLASFSRAALRANPRSIARFLRDSRLGDRVGARLLAQLRGRLR